MPAHVRCFWLSPALNCTGLNDVDVGGFGHARQLTCAGVRRRGRLIGLPCRLTFTQSHTRAAMAWHRQVMGADWATPADVKRAIRSASILKDGRVVFNIAGNKYRIVVSINYPYRVVYIRFVGTHRRYDAINAQTV